MKEREFNRWARGVEQDVERRTDIGERSIRSSMVAWSYASDEVEVGDWPDETRWSDSYDFTHGACDAEIRHLDDQGARRFVIWLAADMVIAAGVNPRAVHHEFLKIREYVEAMAIDGPGMEIAKRKLAEMDNRA